MVGTRASKYIEGLLFLRHPGIQRPVSPCLLLLLRTKAPLNSKQVALPSLTQSLGSTGAPEDYKGVPLLESLPVVSLSPTSRISLAFQS